jgi:hypothetical protein
MVSASISKQQLNAAVKQLEAKDRPAAVEILGCYGVLNTAVLPPEKWQAVYDVRRGAEKIRRCKIMSAFVAIVDLCAPSAPSTSCCAGGV